MKIAGLVLLLIFGLSLTNDVNERYKVEIISIFKIPDSNFYLIRGKRIFWGKTVAILSEENTSLNDERQIEIGDKIILNLKKIDNHSIFNTGIFRTTTQIRVDVLVVYDSEDDLYVTSCLNGRLLLDCIKE